MKYIISIDPTRHVYSVKLEFVANNLDVTLKLPTWIPGSYMIREFSKNIITLKASQNQFNINSTQINKNTWQLKLLSLNQSVLVEYEVYAYDKGIRGAYLDPQRGFFNPSSICLYLSEYQELQHSLTFENLPHAWNIATGLTNAGDFYIADNYAKLIDNPFELGEFTKIPFLVKDTPHYFVISGKIHSNFDSNRLVKDTIKICQTQIDLFGGNAPFSSYTVLLNLNGDIYTGLEHENSTALMAPYYALPCKNNNNKDDCVEIADDYLKLLCLISHEYFHSWNVKRIKPQVFNPYNLEIENYTKLLWWFEGITSYYDDLMVYRAGLVDKNCYLNFMLNNINNVYKFMGNSVQTLANSSITSWVKYYRPDENSPNSNVSYYIKGALVGTCLDLLIRDLSKGLHSLDTVIRGLYNKWLDDGRGIEEDELPQLIKNLTGVDLTDDIAKFTESTDVLPLDILLSKFGLELTAYTGHHADMPKVLDISMSKKVESINKIELGLKLVKDVLGYKVLHVYEGAIAQKFGLAASDLILAIDKVILTDWDKQISLYKANDTITFSIIRQDTLIELSGVLSLNGLPKVSYITIKDLDKLKLWL